MNLGHGFCVQHVQNGVCRLLQFLIRLTVPDFLDQDDVLLIYRSNEILRLGSK